MERLASGLVVRARALSAVSGYVLGTTQLERELLDLLAGPPEPSHADLVLILRRCRATLGLRDRSIADAFASGCTLAQLTAASGLPEARIVELLFEVAA